MKYGRIRQILPRPEAMRSDLPNIPNYAVRYLIAEGGTARVYWGIDLRSGYAVAIKELKIRYLNNDVVRKNFKETETRLYLYMNHPNIPKLVDFLDIDGRLYIVMEYVEGKNLEEYIYSVSGLIPEERALPMFLKILDTVGYMHSEGYLHLDIKPSNIMLTQNDNIKLIDLGIASRIRNSSTSTGYGTAAYMAPEQSAMGRCGVYTDIFALGIMLFEMLTAHLPFYSNKSNAKEAREEIRNKIRYDSVPKMETYYPFINPGLQRVVERALEKEPACRYQSCEDFRDAILDYEHRKR